MKDENSSLEGFWKTYQSKFLLSVKMLLLQSWGVATLLAPTRLPGKDTDTGLTPAAMHVFEAEPNVEFFN